MATGTGIDAQLMFGQESTWGTPVTPTRALEFNSESLKRDITWLEPVGLRAGIAFKRTSRMLQSRFSVSGDVELDIATLGMGMLVRNMLGSATTTTTLIAGTAYKQIHTPGGFVGLGLTAQVGRPEPGGTVRPFTFAGCKIPKWEINLKDNSTPSLKLTVDGKSESTVTALATPSYLASSVFTFQQATLKLGGTPSTASGETTIAGGTTVATIVKDITISGDTPLAVDRYGIGNAGLKAEQIGPNGIPTVTGKLGAEFSKTEFYDLYTAGTATALQFDLTGSVIGGANSYLFSVILPSVLLKNAAPTVSGPDIVQMSTDFEAGSNGTDPVIQIKIVSTEATTV